MDWKNQKGKNNYSYIDGRTLIKHYCIDCKIKQISYSSWRYGKQRCKSCANKGDLNPMNGKKPHNFRNATLCKCGNKKATTSQVCQKCYMIFNSGKNHHWWVNGISKEGYPCKFNYIIKKFIRQRDNYICQLCNQKGIHIHHINYDKQNCEETNLITLCRNCHTKTNFNRDYWYAYFIYLMENR